MLPAQHSPLDISPEAEVVWGGNQSIAIYHLRTTPVLPRKALQQGWLLGGAQHPPLPETAVHISSPQEADRKAGHSTDMSHCAQRRQSAGDHNMATRRLPCGYVMLVRLQGWAALDTSCQLSSNTIGEDCAQPQQRISLVHKIACWTKLPNNCHIVLLSAVTKLMGRHT